MGLPEPLKMRPSMSRDTGVFNTCGKQEEAGQGQGQAQGIPQSAAAGGLCGIVHSIGTEGKGTGTFV
jgi:hypothetical protein